MDFFLFVCAEKQNQICRNCSGHGLSHIAYGLNLETLWALIYFLSYCSLFMGYRHTWLWAITITYGLNLETLWALIYFLSYCSLFMGYIHMVMGYLTLPMG